MWDDGKDRVAAGEFFTITEILKEMDQRPEWR